MLNFTCEDLLSDYIMFLFEAGKGFGEFYFGIFLIVYLTQRCPSPFLRERAAGFRQVNVNYARQEGIHFKQKVIRPVLLVV